MHHQSSRLSFVLAPANDGSSSISAQQQHWKVRGTSTLYVTDTAPPLPTTTQLAFHLRGNCQVTSVQVETMGVVPSDVLTPSAAVKQEEGVLQSIINNAAKKPALETWKTNFDHMDPLEHVLIKPAGSYTETDFLEPPPDAASSTDTSSNNKSSPSTAKRYDADAQCSRGAAGMTTGLRAASIASNMGELRLSIERPNNAAGRPPLKPPAPAPEVPPKDGTSKPKIDEAELRHMAWLKEQWENDLQGNVGGADDSTSNTNTALGGSKIAHDLHERLHSRTEQRRAARIELVATRLAEASMTEHGRRAFKITVQYEIPTSSSMQQQLLHTGGLHMLPATPHLPPHIYTTAGVFGDHEGTRSWLPCLDSASYKHRSSHEWTISVTAPMREGLRVVGAGEDFGVSDTRLHYKQPQANKAKEARELLGADHVKWVEEIFAPSVMGNNSNAAATTTEPHVIPPDTDVTMREVDDEAAIKDSTTVASMDDILATQIWASTSWMPIPARSLGFAIGPFQVAEDPEYFGLPDIELEEEEGGDSLGGSGAGTLRYRRQLQLEREKDRIEDARVRGEGIRQVYFAPFYERKYLHATANTLLLEDSFVDDDDSSSDKNDQEKEANAGDDTEEMARSSVVEIHLPPRTSRQHRLSLGLEETVLFATAGVAHRALSLMRDILALPAYRTSAYTQIWIPHAVNGGYSCGALHSCPEVLGANAFLGGAIIDAGLLPPIGKRITFFQGGGRVLQMIQARCAVRGWITACLPLGGQDDVGGGYIHSLIESFMMSFYERGHGAFGEGKTGLSG